MDLGIFKMEQTDTTKVGLDALLSFFKGTESNEATPTWLSGAQVALQAWDAFNRYKLGRRQLKVARDSYNTNLKMQTSLLNRDLYNKEVMHNNYHGTTNKYNSFQDWLEKSPDAYKNQGI